MRLGEGFTLPPVHVEPEPHRPSLEELRNEQLLVAIAALQDALLSMPRPEVHVEAPDLTAIVQAVTGLKPGATSEDIASAVVRQISPTSQTDTAEVLSKVVKALEKLDFRMQGGGGSNVSGVGRDVKLLGANNNPVSTENRLPVDIGGDVNIGNLTVQYESRVSTLNSTATPLAANEAFTGAWEDVRDYAAISVAVLTDANSAANGAVIQFTEDPAAGPLRSVATTIPAGVGSHFSLAPQARYFRLWYMNGGTAQTLFRNEVQLKFNPPAQVQQPLAATITDANLATVTRSHLAGRQSSGLWTPIGVNSVGHASMRVPDLTVTGTLQAVDSTVLLSSNNGGLSSFSFDITGFTTGTFVIERTLNPTPTTGTPLWTAVGAFKAGTRTSRSTWSEVGAFHGNMSASTAVRLRVTSALNTPAAVNMLGGAGTGTITVGAIASNEGNIIGAVQDLGQHYATTAGGNASWNSSTDFLTLSSTGEQPVAALSNPAGSGVDLFVLGYELNAAAITQWRRYRNATLSALGTAQASVNRGGDTAKVSAGKVYRGAGSSTEAAAAQFARTGGALGKATALAANMPHDVDLNGEVRLRPGQNWVFTATGPGGLGGTMVVSFFADWYELPAS